MNTRTRILRSAGLTPVVVMILTSVAMAQQPAQPKASPQSPAAAGGKPGVVVADVIEVRAKVDAVDYDKRLVTLTGPHTVVVKAGPQVRNLDQIKAGDQLVIRHLESVALFVRKSGEPPHASEVAVVEVAAKGQKPGGIMVDTVEVTGRVEAIDYAKRKLTLIGPGGKAKTVKVDPAVKRFKEVKKGDEVVLRHTEAFAIAVRKP